VCAIEPKSKSVTMKGEKKKISQTFRGLSFNQSATTFALEVIALLHTWDGKENFLAVV
jgi:hypothetical protein